MKHAFLIMAHANYNLLGRLLKKLDHPDNTLYLHIDAKSAFSKEDEAFLVGCCKASKVLLVDRHRVNWGGYSQINIELRMLEAAWKNKHDYYHFLSGADFPTKSMSEIHQFFEDHAGFEFVHFCADSFSQKETHRYRLYHFFREKCGRTNKPYLLAEKISLSLQRRLGIDRTKKYPHITFKCGANWVSVTHGFVGYLLSKQEEIQKMFSHSLCCDEFFLQTILYNSPFREKIYSEDESRSSNLRSVDWKRADPKTASPYTYTVRDYEDLVRSENLFCRKVSDATPEENALIERLEAP